MTPLRILLVLPMYGGSLPVGRYCRKALLELGHTVETFEAPEFHPAFTALKGLRVTTDRLEYLENSFLQVVSQAILAKVETFEPDLVLALAQAPLSHQALKRLRRDKVVTAMWFVEDFRLFTYWRSFAPWYDFFAVIQQEPFLEQLRELGVENPLYLPLAALPSFHKPLALSPVEQRKYGSDISFVGAGYPNRRVAFRRLMGLDFKIWGSDWEGESVLRKHIQLEGARVSSEEMVKIFNATRINVNLHSSVHSRGRAKEAVTQGDFVNPRTFELAACGAFQLVDHRELLPELFGPEELAVFSDMDHLLERIDYFHSRPEERGQWAQRGRERVLAEHTYAHRMATLIEHIRAVRPDWSGPRTDPDPVWAALPDDIQEQAQTLLQSLGLPRDAAFQDLVWAIRQRQGVLSDVETAVLFLDEWRKQYCK